MPDGNSDVASRASTPDVDIAAFERLSLAIEDTATPALADVLATLDFTPIPSLDPARVWKWGQSASDARVEFLTPSFGEDEGRRDLPSLGGSARALPHLNYLLAERKRCLDPTF